MPIAKVSYVAHVPGHKNSQGEAAPWVVKSHEDGHIISSHKTKAEAKEHLRQMHAHSGSKISSMNTALLDDFTRSYLTAVLWSSTDDEGTPLDGKYGIEDIAPSTLEVMVKDCQQFQQQNYEALTEKGTTQGGHDFWLTRNNEGAGFWDGEWPENGKALTLAAKKFGEVDLYIGDDGYIYQSGKETPSPVPPRKEYNPTSEELAELKAMGIIGSKKFAEFLVAAADSSLTSAQAIAKAKAVTDQVGDLLFHNLRGIAEAYLVNIARQWATRHPNDILKLDFGMGSMGVSVNGKNLTNSELYSNRWWLAVENTLYAICGDLYKLSVPREMEVSQGRIRFIGSDTIRSAKKPIAPQKKSKLLDRPQPKLALGFNPQSGRQYDYEANGKDVVLISPANTTKLLQGDEARNFWVALDQIENETTESAQEDYQKRVQDLVRSYFDQEAKVASKKCVIQVDASKLKKGSITFISGVEYKEDGKVDRLKFISKREKAARFLHSEAMKIKAQLPDFRLGGALRDA